MSSLGDLYFALGLDDKEFNNALDAAKKRVAELGADVSINLNIDASKVANEVQKELNALSNKKIETGVGVKKEDLDKLKSLTASIAEAEKELSNLESAKFKNTSAIERAKGFLETLRKQYDELIKVQNLAAKGQEAISEVSTSEQTVQHVVAPEAIAEVKALTEAMNGLNTQMEVSNRLRELSLNKKKGKTRTDLEKEAKWASEIRDEYQKEGRGGTTAEYESIEYIRAQNLLKKQYEEQQAIAKELERIEKEEKKLEEKAKLAQKAKKARNEAISKQLTSEMLSSVNSIGQQSPEIKALNSYYRQLEKSSASEAKSSNSKLKEQLLQLQRLEQAIKKLQYMRVDLDTSGIDEDSFAYKRATMLLDDYIKKLQEMQSSGKTLSKNKVDDVLGIDFSRTISDVNHSVSEELRAQKRIAEETRRAAREEEKRVKLVDKLKKGLKTSSDWASQLNNQITNAFSIYAIERFIRNLYTVGGEFQKQEIALRNMIGDAGKANILFERMKDLSVKSPFTFSELSSYTKQMAAYGIEYNELYDTTKRLADISAGVGVDMGRLILAYGQVRSAEVLRGQELRQFTEAGIPIVAELAKRLEEVRGKSVAIGEVFDAISKREISFGMVKDVLFDMTDPGGKFFKTQEELAESLAGKWSNLKDAWDIMIADIANGNNTILAGLADNLAWITRNWEGWLPIVTGVTLAIGSYKAIIEATTIAQGIFNAVSKANPWVALASIIGGAAFAIWGYASNSKTASEEMQELNRELEKSSQMLKDNESTALRYLDSLKAQNTSEERRVKLLKELEKLYPSIFEGMSTEQVMLKDTLSLKRDIATATKDMTLAEVDKAILSKQQEKDKLWKEDWKRLTTPGNNDKHSQNDARIKELESQITELTEKKVTLEKELAWKEQEKALNDKSTVEEYVAVYGEIGKAVKILRDAGIKNGNLTSPSMSDRDLIEYYEKLNSALREQETTMKNFKVGSDTYNKASASAEVYKKAIEAINGVWNTKDGKDARREAERAAKEKAKKEVEAYLEALKNEVSTAREKFSLFKELFESTGDKSLATKIAFNSDEISFKNEVEWLKKRIEKELANLKLDISFNELIGLGEKQLLVDERIPKEMREKVAKSLGFLIKTYNDANTKLSADTAKEFGEIIKEAKTFEEKIDEINRSLQDKLGKLATLPGYEMGTKAYKDASKVLIDKAEEEKGNLFFEQFKKSSSWGKLFDNLDRVSKNTLKRMYKEMENFKNSTNLSVEAASELGKKMDELRNKMLERSPFEAFSEENLTKLYNARKRVDEIKDEIEKAKKAGDFSSVVDLEIKLSEEQDKIKAQYDNYDKAISHSINKFNEVSNAVGEVSAMLEKFGNKSLSNLAKMMDSIAGGMQSGYNVGNLFGGAGGVVGAFFGTAVGAMAGIAEAGQKAVEAEQERSQIVIDRLSKVASLLKDKIENSLTGLYNTTLDATSRIELEKKQKQYGDAENYLKNLGADLTSEWIALTKDNTTFSWDTNDYFIYSKKTQEAINKALDTDNAFMGAYASLLAQRDELIYQKESYTDKDSEDVEAFKADKQIEIEQLNMEIEQLSKDMMSSLYSIDFKDWAGQLTDAIVNAWASGEDAAKAYGDTVSSILKNVASSMVQQMIIGQYMEDNLKPFVDDFIANNGLMDESLYERLVDIVDGVEQKTEDANKLLDTMEEIANKKGYSLKDSTKTEGLSKGIQSVTEDTANLLGSYLNAIRQDVSVKRTLLEQLVGSDVPKMNYLAEAQLQQLQMVVSNTKRNADTADKIYSLIDRVVDKGGNRLKI